MDKPKQGTIPDAGYADEMSAFSPVPLDAPQRWDLLKLAAAAPSYFWSGSLLEQAVSGPKRFA